MVHRFVVLRTGNPRTGTAHVGPHGSCLGACGASMIVVTRRKKPGNFRHFQLGSTRKSQSRDLYSLAAHCFGFGFFLSASRYVSVGPSLSLTIFSPYTSTIDDLVAVGQFRRSRSGGCSSVVCGSGRHERGKLQEDYYHPRHPILCVVQMFHFISH